MNMNKLTNLSIYFQIIFRTTINLQWVRGCKSLLWRCAWMPLQKYFKVSIIFLSFEHLWPSVLCLSLVFFWVLCILLRHPFVFPLPTWGTSPGEFLTFSHALLFFGTFIILYKSTGLILIVLLYVPLHICSKWDIPPLTRCLLCVYSNIIHQHYQHSTTQTNSEFILINNFWNTIFTYLWSTL